MLHGLRTSARQKQPHICAALVLFEPPLLDRVLDAGGELRAGGLELVEKGRVDLLDMNAAVLDGFNALCEFDQFAGCGFWVGERAFGGEFHRYPIAGTVGVFQSKCGRTSAPRLPQAWQIKCDSRSDNRTSSDHQSALNATLWPHR